MTRIFEALKKSQSAAAPVPFPQPPPPPLQPVAGARAMAHAASPHAAVSLTPRVESAAAAALPEDVSREMSALRIGIESALEARATRAVLFTSSVGREGTSTVAAQFATHVASDPRTRVVLVDLHARRPALAERFGAAGEPAARHGGDPAGAAHRPAASFGVVTMPDEVRRVGACAPAAVRQALGTLSTQYDWVVLDGPPVLEAREAADLAALADGVVIVVRSGHTKRPVVTRAVDLLRKSGARVLGSVLNRRRLEIPDFIYRRI